MEKVAATPTQIFHLSQSEDVKNFLYSPDLSCIGKIQEFVVIQFTRICHFFQEGEWIDEHACLQFCLKNYDPASLQDLEAIESRFNKEIAKQFIELQTHVNSLSFYEELETLLLFIKRFIHDPAGVGALFPCSKSVAERTVKNIPRNDDKEDIGPPRRILEVGAGIGRPFTIEIVENHLRPQDTLHIVEIDEEFCKILEKQYGHLKNVTIHKESVLDLKETGFDYIVSSIPTTTFSVKFVTDLFLKYASMIKADGYISYVQYLWITDIKQYVLCGESLQHLKDVLEVKEKFEEKCLIKGDEGTDNVYLNLICPIKASHCQVSQDNKDSIEKEFSKEIEVV
jgi:phospholipid N-methyltransferase